MLCSLATSRLGKIERFLKLVSVNNSWRLHINAHTFKEERRNGSTVFEIFNSFWSHHSDSLNNLYASRPLQPCGLQHSIQQRGHSKVDALALPTAALHILHIVQLVCQPLPTPLHAPRQSLWRERRSQR